MTEIVNPTSGEIEDVKKMFADYQKKQIQSKKKTSEEILKKYFVPRNTKETFRILPPKAGKRPIEEAFFHVVTTNIAGGKKKHGSIIYCPAHNDGRVPKLFDNGEPMLDMGGKEILVPTPCPLCEQHKRLLARQDQSLKGIKKENMTPSQLKIKEKNDAIYKEAIGWEAKKFYIVRGIDKGVEKDGVKFWRFKHNFKNQGTFDKLYPVLDDYIQQYGVLFSDVQKGCDLAITMADSEFNGKTYKQITAITPRQPSVLHSDPIVIRQWLDDDITWRNVFLAKKAPNTTPNEFLKMIVRGENPYWDDTDSNNKHWVFPNNPELEALANTRNQNLDNDEEYFEYASDISEDSVTISNVQPSNVGTYTSGAIDMGKVAMEETKPVIAEEHVAQPKAATKKANNPTPPAVVEPSVEENGEFDDLPF